MEYRKQILIIFILVLIWWFLKNRKPKAKGVILKNVNFDFNSANLTPESSTELDKLADYLGKTPANLTLIGHTDSVGDDAYNMNLSKQRAEAVKNYLVTKGIDGKRLATIGKGETEPLTNNDTEENRKINRRVEYVLNTEITN